MRCVAAARKTLGDGAVAERRAVVLGQVVGVEARVLVALDEREALLELLADRQPAERQAPRTRRRAAGLVDVVEDPELHLLPPSRPRTAGA